jgi:hypothetical protein
LTIRRSRVLVMKGTEGALPAPYLAFEVEEARRAGKAILPVDVDGSVRVLRSVSTNARMVRSRQFGS